MWEPFLFLFVHKEGFETSFGFAKAKRANKTDRKQPGGLFSQREENPSGRFFSVRRRFIAYFLFVYLFLIDLPHQIIPRILHHKRDLQESYTSCQASLYGLSAYPIRGGDKMTPCELTASITAVANTLSCKLTVDELNLLGAVLSQLGDTLTTIATQKNICEQSTARFVS